MRFFFLFSLCLVLCNATLYAQDSLRFTEEEVSIELKEGILYGTLTIPQKARKKTPIVLLIPGSGPTDRDCNSAFGLRSDAFVMLAEGLAGQGIACLRIDKRISGKSAATFKSSNDSLRFDAFIEDNERWITWIRADKRFGKLTVCGHSQGAPTGMIAVLQKGADNYISLCGAGRPADQLMREQFIAMAPEQEAVVNQFFDSIVSGGYDDSAPLLLKMSVSQSLADFVGQYAWYDPASYISQVECPILIVQGERDLQVPMSDAALLHAAALKSQLAIIPEMNHVLKVAPEDRQGNLETYGQFQLPIHEQLVPILARFILNGK